jgi:outer membrane lipoprotein-sorting protein
MRFRNLGWSAGASLAATLCITTPAPAQQAGPAALLARVQTHYRDAESLKIDFDQAMSNPLTGSTTQSKGTMYRKSPNQFAISFSDPSTGDRIVCDGSVLWIYLPSSVPNQVIKMPVTAATAAASDPLGAVLTAPAGKFTTVDAGTGTVNGKAVRKVTITPKSRDMLFAQATVWIDPKDGVVLRIETVDRSGVERRVSLTDQATGVSVPSGTFTFAPPANVRVINQSGATSK